MRGFDLCVDLVVSSDYLFDMDVFTKNADDSLDIDSEEDVVRFFVSVLSIVPWESWITSS